MHILYVRRQDGDTVRGWVLYVGYVVAQSGGRLSKVTQIPEDTANFSLFPVNHVTSSCGTDDVEVKISDSTSESESPRRRQDKPVARLTSWHIAS